MTNNNFTLIISTIYAFSILIFISCDFSSGHNPDIDPRDAPLFTGYLEPADSPIALR